MIAGDPYRTKLLDEARSRHRRFRDAATGPLDWNSPVSAMAVAEPDPAVEYYARQAVDLLLEGHEAFVAYLESRRSANLLSQALEDIPDSRPSIESAKIRLSNRGLTMYPAPPRSSDGGSDDKRIRLDLLDAVLLIDIAEMHSRGPTGDDDDLDDR